MNKYNNFKDDENIISNNSYIKNLNKKLEQKEEELNKLNYKNKKLNEKLQNKSSSVKNEKLNFGKFSENFEKHGLNGLNKSNSNKNIINTDIQRSNNNSIIEKIINYYDNRELNYKNEISKLETKIRDTEDLQSNINNIKGISLQSESDFIDDIEGSYMIKYLKDKNIIKKKDSQEEDILKDIPGNESDLDEVKGLKTLTKYLKNDNREKDKKLKNLTEKIKELFKKLKYDNKIKQEISNILELIGYSPDKIKNIIKNNNGFLSIE